MQSTCFLRRGNSSHPSSALSCRRYCCACATPSQLQSFELQLQTLHQLQLSKLYMGWVVQSLRQDLKFKQLLRSLLTTQRLANNATKATLTNAFKLINSSVPILNRPFMSRNSFGNMIVQVCKIGFL